MGLFYCFVDVPSEVCSYDLLTSSLNVRLRGNSPSHCDAISHFVMCVFAALNPHLKHAIYSIERKIFEERLQAIDISDLTFEMQELRAKLEVVQKQSEIPAIQKVYFSTIARLCTQMEARMEHSFAANHSLQCRKIKLLVPFALLLNLVSNREVELKAGKAVVPCSIWRLLLQNLFEYLMSSEVERISSNSALLKAISHGEDDRIRRLMLKCEEKLVGHGGELSLKLGLLNIDNASRYFPPCMAQLHQILRKTHRLSYDSRCQFTLFLKDAGLSLEDNEALWKEEYNRPCNGSDCQHTWCQKGDRYVYQLKHMYGLVGESREKFSWTCKAFIDSSTAKMNSGCPFKWWSDSRIRAAIPYPFSHAAESIIQTSRKDPQLGCALYLSYQAGASLHKCISSPIQYYRLATSCLKGTSSI